MTLAELAALAAKVEGFVLPMGPCEECEAKGRVYRNEFYHLNGGFVPCPSCNGTKVFPSDDPAALLMAVAAWNYTKGRDLQTRSWLWGYNFIIRDGGGGRGLGELKDGTPESIARAALVALMRAHGVEVADE